MKTILVVENEQETISSLSEILNRFGYNVITEQSCRSALSVLKGGAAVDLVITEERLPDMDGLELIASLKEFKPDIPSIMLTTQGSVASYVKAFNLGVFDYLNKPVSARLIDRVIKAAIEGEPLRSSPVASFLDR